MQTRTYGELFKLIRSLAGVGAFSANELDDVANLINRRFLQIFNESPIWPRYLVTSEERKIIALTITNAAGSGATDVNGNYFLLGTQKSGGTGLADTGSLIYYKTQRSNDGSQIIASLIFKQDNAWKVTTGGKVNYTPDGIYDVTTSGTHRYVEIDNPRQSFPYDVEVWTVSNGADNSPHIVQKQAIPYEETLGHSSEPKNTIGEFVRIHRKKAFLNNSAMEYDFSVDKDGANILNIANTSDKVAFVTYKKQFSPFTVTGTVSSDFTDSTVEVPGEFFSYLAHATYADFLRMDGQTAKAFAEEERANLALALELEKVDIISNNNTVNKRFSTYVNRQSR